MQRPLILKCVLLLALTVLLLVPLSMIERTIGERSFFREEAVRAIANGSAGPQTLTGPILAIPVDEEYDEEVSVGTGEERRLRTVRRKRTHVVTVLPRRLNVEGALQVERRAYGIHAASVFDMHAILTGSFEPPTEADLPVRGNRSELRWGRPRLVVGVADVRGLTGEPKVMLAEHEMPAVRGTAPSALPAGFHAEFPAAGMPTRPMAFRVDLNLAGTESVAVVPLADLTTTRLRGNWPHPSFGGDFLPRERQVGDQGFEARWSVTSLANNLQRDALSGAKAGHAIPAYHVRLIDPVDIYRQALRAVKYGLLFVGVLFAAFFAYENIRALPIHPIQYLLVGLALAQFFLLLVSLSEHVAFAAAYGISALASVALIGTYLSAVLRGWRPAAGATAGLAVLYAALFGVLQSEQNALLLGSLLLFAVLASLMLGTRRIDWYRVGAPAPRTAAAELRP